MPLRGGSRSFLDTPNHLRWRPAVSSRAAIRVFQNRNDQSRCLEWGSLQLDLQEISTKEMGHSCPLPARKTPRLLRIPKCGILPLRENRAPAVEGGHCCCAACVETRRRACHRLSSCWASVRPHAHSSSVLERSSLRAEGSDSGYGFAARGEAILRFLANSLTAYVDEQAFLRLITSASTAAIPLRMSLGKTCLRRGSRL